MLPRIRESEYRPLSINGTKNHAKEIVLMMWLREYDKNGWQNAHEHSASQKVIEEWWWLCDSFFLRGFSTLFLCLLFQLT